MKTSNHIIRPAYLIDRFLFNEKFLYSHTELYVLQPFAEWIKDYYSTAYFKSTYVHVTNNGKLGKKPSDGHGLAYALYYLTKPVTASALLEKYAKMPWYILPDQCWGVTSDNVLYRMICDIPVNVIVEYWTVVKK